MHHVSHTPCARCDGRGRIVACSRISGGLCFRCGGTGYLRQARPAHSRESSRWPGWFIVEGPGDRFRLVKGGSTITVELRPDGSWLGRCEDGFEGDVAACIRNEQPF